MRKRPAFKISIRSVRKFFTTFLIIAVSFASGFLVSANGYKAALVAPGKVTITRELPPGKENLDFSLFWRVWDTLEASYYDKDKLSSRDMVYGAIKGMVSSVGDPYTVFLPPTENKVVQEDLSGTFEGVGIQIGFKGTRLTVVAPLPDSPAQEAGIRAGDFIVGIKDEIKGIDMGTNNITLPEAVEAIRGTAGSKVTLLLIRDDNPEPIEVEVVRRSIEVPSVTVDYVGNGDIAHIRLLKFSGETDAEWTKAVSDILSKGNVKGVLLDVRNNPGGYLQASVDVASEFLKAGQTVVIEELADGQRNEFKVERIGKLQNMPVIVLINQGSASASEILAGALRDDGGVTLVGETTFGKGTIQEPRQINGGSGLHITTARWLTPSGYWVNEKGLEPDNVVEDNIDTNEDEQLNEAMKLLE
jgi:carboxyl-terminal processing protease